jgi:hypothetical protein
MPKNRLKLRVIDYGYGTFFYGDELRGVKLIQEIDPISTQISINTADFTLDSKTDMEYSFQAKQPLSVYFNGELKATTFVKKSTRKAKRLWSIQSEDYIGVMDSVFYYGGIYTNKNAVELLTDIFTVAKVPYSIDDVFADTVVTGYIPYTTCRDALMQVAFAIQAVIDTSNSEVVKVFVLEEDVKQTIPLNRIMQGQNFSDDETVTGVKLSLHSYKKDSLAQFEFVYIAMDSGAGDNILVVFSDPVYQLQMGTYDRDEEGEYFNQSDSVGTILKSGENYALINIKENGALRAKKYTHSSSEKQKNNELILAGQIENIISINDATLISNANIDKVLNSCYNWLTKNKATNLKIVEGKHVQYGESVKWGERKWGTFKWGEKCPNIVTYDAPVNVGENIKAETEYLGVVEGRLIKQSFNLNGNIIIKEAVLK